MNKMQHKLNWLTPWLRVLCLSLLVGLTSIGVKAQTTTTITCTGSAGSYNSGSVNSAGTKNDGNMTTINSSTNRGWAVFNLSGIPTGSTIVSANLLFTTYSSTLSSAVNNCYGFTGNPATMAGSALYTACASGTSWNASSWTAAALQTKAVSAAGLTAIAANLGGSINVGYVRGSTNTYNIYGYAGTAPPQLQITYISSTPCIGTPAPGNTLSSVASPCPGASFTLSLQNSTSGSGVTYQWYNSAGAIAGATASSYATSITSADTYYCDVTCSGSTGTSTPITLTPAGFLTCYCIPTTTSGCGAGDHITNVTFLSAGNPVNNTTGACLTASYSDYTSTIATAQVTQLDVIPPGGISVSVNNGGTEYAGAWIDYNQSGTFDASEYITLTDADAAAPWVYTNTTSYVIPVTATVGLTRMRFRSSYNAVVAANSACSTYSYGETEDYYVNIALTLACTGTPNPGNTLASTTLACSGQTVNFSLQNLTTGTGVTYQWFNNNGPIAGATNAFYSQAITFADDFYCEVSCSGGTAVPSNLVSIAMDSYLNCYCAASSQYGTSGGPYGSIFNVSLGSIANATSYPAAAPYYTNYPAGAGTTTNILPGTNYQLSVTVAGYAQAGVWFDFNQNGVFDASEFTFLGTNSSGVNVTYTTNVAVPLTAPSGLIKMRIRGEAYFYANLTGTQACGNTYYGETEDYTITVDPLIPCTGLPNPGNTIASANNVCPGTNVTFTLQNSIAGIGVSFQWYNNAGAIAGATNSFYSQAISTPDDYYCMVSCAGSGQSSPSNLVSMTIAPFYNCYCASGATTTYDEEIYQITVNGATTPATYANTNGCTTPAPGPGSILSRYSNFSPLGPLTTLSLGQTVSFEVRENECDGATFYGNGIGVWIDYNQNGLFTDPGEAIYIEATTTAATGATPGGDKVITGTFTIPTTALTGQTAMRVIAAEGYAGASLTPCLSYGYGETEDWIVNIAPLPANPANPIQVNVPNCATGGQLAAVGTAPVGETWYWQTTATGTSTTDPAVNNLTILANGTYYIRSQSNAYGTWSAGAGSITVTNFPAGPADPTISSPANPACGSVSLISSTALAGTTNYWQGNNPTGTSTSSIADDGTTNTPIVTTSNGTYYLRAQDNVSFCWSNTVAITATVLTVPTTPIVSANPSVICPSSNAALSAIAPSAPPAGYTVSTIPYSPISPIATTLANAGPTGDEGTTVASLGFPFNYYGTTYNNVTVHTNGYIVFGTYAFGSYTPPTIPSTANTNGWVGYWSDLNAGAGQISYATVGTAPNRMFVANYNNVPYYSATPYYSGQIVVYEATGAIDVYLEHTQTTYTSACGMENQTGSAGVAAPGYNSGSWAATNSAFRFSPIQSIGFLWTPNGAGSGIAAGNETLANTLTTPSATTTYTVTITDPVNGCTNSNSLTVTVMPTPAAPATTGGATLCGSGPATLSATGTGGTLQWYDVPTGGTILATGSSYTTPVITANTTYYVEETNGTCVGPRSAVVATYTPADAVTAISNVNYICAGGTNNQAVLTASSLNTAYVYTWMPGGLTGNSVTVSPTSTTTYTVTGSDGICSNVATITVNVGVVPTIYSATATPAILCVSGTSQLAVDAGEFAPTNYCTPTLGFTGASGDFIENFSINTLVNNVSGDNPSDYALYTQTTSLQVGSTYTINAAPGTAWGQGIGVWIDFNRNGSFADAGEFVFSSPSGTTPVSGTVTIPTNVSGGKTRIRVACKYGATVANTESCGHTGFGEYEDYIVTLSSSTGALSYNWTPSTGLSSATVSSPTATLSATSTYTVSISDPYGCATSTSLTVTVNQPSSSTDNITACGSYTWAANGQSYTAAGTYTATSLNAGGCTHTSTLNLTIACNTTVNLVCFIQGYWDGTSAMVPALFNQGEVTTTGACDSIDVELRSDVAPYGVDASVRAVLNQDGTATCVFPPVTGNKYIVVKHRSALQTWSANPVAMGTTASYNFSDADTKAYGNNMVQVSASPAVWAFYSGDVVVDENMDLLDLGAVESDISNFGYGYLPTDLNGDGNVDLLDSPMLETNISAFIYSNHP